MRTHVRILGTLLIIGGLVSLAAAGSSHLVFRVLGGFVETSPVAEDASARLALRGIGWVFASLFGTAAVVSLLCGWGLLRLHRWARVLGVVLAAITLVFYPVGTLAGAYALWVLLNRRTEALFAACDASAN